jgi:DNA repair protein RecO (recombination protein O)
LGSLDCELVEAYAVRFLDDPDRLAAVTAATALLLTALTEREPNAELYQSLAALLGALTPALPSPAPTAGFGRGQTLDSAESWEQSYVRWECGLLAALGFGLDLGRCAVTGVTDDLAYVSPRSGRAVSRMAGEPYRDKLLPLPGFLWRDGHADRPDIAAGLVLTRYFLLHHLLLPHGRQLPEARERLAERMRRPQPLV